MNFASRKIAMIGASLLGLLAVIAVALLAFNRHLAEPPHRTGGEPVVSPRLQVEFESGALARTARARQQRRLEESRALGGGFVSLPIHETMRRLAAQGVWP